MGVVSAAGAGKLALCKRAPHILLYCVYVSQAMRQVTLTSPAGSGATAMLFSALGASLVCVMCNLAWVAEPMIQ